MYGGVRGISIGDTSTVSASYPGSSPKGPGYEAMLSVDLWHTYCPRVHVNVYRGK